jgi:hypothetical protein
MKISEIIVLVEGGNVFDGKTAPIKREYVQSTLNAYFSELKRMFPKKAHIFNNAQFVPLGTAGKKDLSGDLDLGISIDDILDKKLSDESIIEWNVNPQDVVVEFDKLIKRVRTSTPENVRIKAFLKCLATYINKSSNLIFVNPTKIIAGNMFTMFPQVTSENKKLNIGVQIDWMIGNLNWLKFSYYSSEYPKGSNVKGLHRTQLMLAAFNVANLSFDHVLGVRDKETGKSLTHDPKEALKILGKRLGFDITSEVAENYYSLQKLFKEKMKPQDYDSLLNIYFKILDSTRADIPTDLQKDWLERKDTLNLTGKFLPDESALRKYV